MPADQVKANRSCRRFDEHHSITLQTHHELIDLGRLSASAANLQPLKYILSCDPAVNERIFECLAWTGPWGTTKRLHRRNHCRQFLRPLKYAKGVAYAQI